MTMTYEQLTPLALKIINNAFKLARRSGKKGLPGAPIILNFNVLNESKKNSLQKIGRG